VGAKSGRATVKRALKSDHGADDELRPPPCR
jgi:hypothetical protein